MKCCIVTERKENFPVKPDGLADTNDVNLIAAMGGDMHFSMFDKDMEKFSSYDLVIVKMSKVKEKYENTWMEFPSIFKKRWPGKALAMYQEAESFWPIFRPVQDQVEFFDAVRKCDIFFAHNTADAEFYKLLKMDERVLFVPSPMPIDKIKSAAVSWDRRERKREIIFGSSFDDRSYALMGYAVACSVMKEIPGWKLVQYSRSRYTDNRNDLMKASFGVPFESLPHYSWFDFVDRISEAYISMNLMPASAAGRDTIAFAALGIPHIGNYRLDPMRTCFPDIKVDVFDCESARKNMIKLIADKDFYMMVSAKARDQVENHHSFDAVKNYMDHHLKNMLGFGV